ncbi:signal peptidase I [Candidatus Woesearchaeota archaeon]|nr:signal peptidase I [Candidatus Woesearchaeota archaeon]
MDGSLKDNLRKVWHFIWEEDSVLSWIVNILLAFVLIKFVVYPGLGFMLSTSHPVVAVVSESMEHKANFDGGSKFRLCDKTFDKSGGMGFDGYWDACGSWYELNMGITKDEFKGFPFRNGFNKGDIMILKGSDPDRIKAGQVIVFRSSKPDPIIHRVVSSKNENGQYLFQTKGDHNRAQIKDSLIDETNIRQSQVIGKAVFRIPFLGYVKLWFTQLTCYRPVKGALSAVFPLAC